MPISVTWIRNTNRIYQRYNSVDALDIFVFIMNISDRYKRLDVGILAGEGLKLSREPKSFQAGIRYFHGLTDPLKENTGKAQYNSSAYLYFHPDRSETGPGTLGKLWQSL